MSAKAAKAVSTTSLIGVISPSDRGALVCRMLFEFSGSFAEFDLSIIAVEPHLLRRERRSLRRTVGAHFFVTRLDRGRVVRLIKFLLAAGEALHPRGARLPHPHEPG